MNGIKKLFSKNSLKTWGPIFSLLTLFGVFFLLLFSNSYDKEKNLFTNIIEMTDISASVSLFFLAIYAYYRYSKEKNREAKFLEELEKAHISGQQDGRGAIVIQAGGGNKNAYKDAESFFVEKLVIPRELVQVKSFGDEKNQISVEDIAAIKGWLTEECMEKLRYTSEIHIIVSGVGVVYAVVADILNNWKTILFYHNENGTYRLWYVDKKSENKLSCSDPLKNEV